MAHRHSGSIAPEAQPLQGAVGQLERPTCAGVNMCQKHVPPAALGSHVHAVHPQETWQSDRRGGLLP